jgi:condensin complex subunit 2
MLASRRTRLPTSSQPLYAGDESDDGTEQDTPRPQRHGLKKRLSEVYNPDADASFGSDPGRVPLRSVNINDDAAEKRRRRKSTKVILPVNAQAGPSSEGAEGDLADTTRAAKQRQQQLNSVAPPPAINVPLDVMSSNFEEWMKMATDNVCSITRVYIFT